jgi:hypothetical protein
MENYLRFLTQRVLRKDGDAANEDTPLAPIHLSASK